MTSTTNANRMRRLAVAGALGLVLTLGSSGPALAGPGKPHASPAHKARPAGSHTRHTEVQRTEQGHTRNDTWTGQNGRTVQRDAEVVNDRANQVRTRDVQWTGPQGRQATRTDVTQRTDDGYTRDSTATGPRGGTVERGVVATRDRDAGTWVKDVTVERTPPPRSNGN